MYVNNYKICFYGQINIVLLLISDFLIFTANDIFFMACAVLLIAYIHVNTLHYCSIKLTLDIYFSLAVLRDTK
jgi:hypothetical protein